MVENASTPYSNPDINENTSGASSELSFKFKVTINLQDALDAFVRYSRLGLFKRAEELYLEMSQGNETCFAIIAERADSLLAQGRYRDLSNFLDDIVKQPGKYPFEEDQKNTIRLLEGLVNIHTTGKLREALGAALSWRAAATSITPDKLSALETHSLRIYLHIITLAYVNSTFVEPQYTQPPWRASTESQEPQMQLWSGFIDLCTNFSKIPTDLWDAQALFRLLLPVLPQKQAANLFDVLEYIKTSAYLPTEERLISGLSIRTAYIRHLIASDDRMSAADRLFPKTRKMLDSFEALVDVDKEFNDTRTRPFLELNLAQVERNSSLSIDTMFYGGMSHSKSGVQEHKIWEIAERNGDLAIQAAFLYTRYLGPREVYFHSNPTDGLPKHFLQLMGDRMGFLNAMADRALSFYKLSTMPYPSWQSARTQLAMENLTKIHEFITSSDESDFKNFRDLLSVFGVPFVRFKGSFASATGLMTTIESKPLKILAAPPEVVKNLQAVDNDLSKTPWPMHYAADKGYSAMVKRLLEMGMDTNVRDINSRTPLIMAVNRGNIETARLLLDDNVDFEAIGDDLQTPLIISVNNGDVNMATLLLEKKADIEAKDANNQTPLIAAVDKGNIGMVTLLLDNKADIEAKDANNQTPLIAAVDKGNIGMVTLLLDNKADIEAKGADNQTPLIAA
ncbi:hypothetical protein V491_00146, partial [Pseudogymnoascus sp. VKM F-3775]